MNKLQRQWQRLYLPNHAPEPDTASDTPTHVPLGEHTRTMVLAAKGPSAWKHLAPVWQGVQAELELPAPAIAANGVDSLQLWFSVSEPVAREHASDFLSLLRNRYLGQPEPHGISQWPAANAPSQTADQPLELVPAQQTGTRSWSAFVASDLASIFADEPWLDVPPNADAQADILARMGSIPMADFLRCLPTGTQSQPQVDQGHTHPLAWPAGGMPAEHTDPRQFLLDVMNNPDVSLALRIEAAKALLGAGRTS